MRLVEVVMLMGAHCVSPVEHTQMMTDATKVQCAVVIEKDTATGSLTVTPGEAAKDPQVAAAMERFRNAPSDPLTGGGTKIVPAWAPAGSPTVETKLPVGDPAAAASAVPPAIAPPPDLAPSTDEVTPQDSAADATAAGNAPAAAPVKKPAAGTAKKVAALMPPEQKRPPAKAPAPKQQPAAATPDTPKQPSQCQGNAVAKWYTAADGHRKYRCVRPETAGDRAPNQLY